MDPPEDLKSLLRDCFRAVQAHVHGRLTEAGYADLRPAHANVLQYLGYDGGLRVQDLASRAQMTWQSMAELVGQLERDGYVVREPDPSDRRARLVTLTAKGRDLIPIAIEGMREVEDAWAAEIGHNELKRLRAALQRLWQVPADGPWARRDPSQATQTGTSSHSAAPD
jgi:DNA-binding MarR family transcriptional regulator